TPQVADSHPPPAPLAGRGGSSGRDARGSSMAGSQDPSDNPVGINVVPLVDIIFCLCVFFMCSFKFKQLEGKFDSWLPRDKGAEGLPDLNLIQDVRVALLWDEGAQKIHRRMGTREFPDDGDLQTAISQ